MKKILFLIITLGVLVTSIAFADVVTFDMGTYNVFGSEISAMLILAVAAIILITMSAIAIFFIMKKFEKKTTKIITTIVIIICCVFLILFLPSVLPSPDYHHGMRVMSTMAVQSYNSMLIQYVGTIKSPSVVKSLLDRVEVVNNSDSSKTYGKVTIEGIDSDEKIQMGKIYDIVVTDYYTDADEDGMDGAIKTISITEHKSNGD